MSFFFQSFVLNYNSLTYNLGFTVSVLFAFNLKFRLFLDDSL